jgi:amidase
LISRDGLLMDSFTQERAGPLTRSVYDAAAMLDTIAGFDIEDLSTAASLGKRPRRPYTSFVDANGARGARIGILRDLFRSGPIHAEGLRLMSAALIDLKRAGAILIDPVSISADLLQTLSTARVNLDEAKVSWNHYFARLGPTAPIRSVDTLLSLQASVRLSGHVLEAAKMSTLESNRHYLEKLQTRETLRLRTINLMDALALDALVYPFKTEPALAEGSVAYESDNPFSAITGLPAIVVPIGFERNSGSPVALELLARPWQEPTLIRLASGFEAFGQHRRLPATTPRLPGEVFDY